MYFELFKNLVKKCKIMIEIIKKKKKPMFSKILGRSEKGKQTSFFKRYYVR